MILLGRLIQAFRLHVQAIAIAGVLRRHSVDLGPGG